MAIDTTDRVARLRALMQKENLHMYVVPSEDAHASEYTAERDLRRQYISGFDGSAGLALITQHQCLLWTDGRYFNQAAQQLDSNWTLMKQGFAGVPTWQEFVLGNVQRNGRVGIDATVIPLLEATSLQRQLAKLGVELVGGKINLIDQIWPDRPPPPAEPVYNHSHATAGRNSADKLADLREFLRSQDAVAFIVTSVDEVCWLFNLRGSDVPFNPVFFSYAIATLDTSVIYADKLIDRGHLPEETEVKPYGRFFPSLHDLPAGKILMSNRASWAIANALKQVEAVKSPIAEAKSVKNDTELTGMRQCHIRDGAALAEFFFDMTRLARDGAQLDEVDAADLLEGKRRAKDKFVGLSFPTISSTGPNGAIIHYRPVKGECAIVDWDAIYLCDSGAQYRDGTTDITRTWHFGRPSDFERKAFTLVLKGHIAIAQLVFPRGTTGYTVDSLARQFLWKEGLDYFHGTSHGVGHFLNVHEPPVGIGTRISFNDVALSPGNVISNEPGFYLDGEFGIRIENIITCRLKRTEHRFGDRDYLAFDTISLHPLCRTMIDVNLLSADEIRWVNAYHVQVLETLGPVVPKEVANWLTDECAPL
ncbi:hypothetical protein PYCC9005_003761 [Savitreella phatthalungensis]